MTAYLRLDRSLSAEESAILLTAWARSLGMNEALLADLPDAIRGKFEVVSKPEKKGILRWLKDNF